MREFIGEIERRLTACGLCQLIGGVDCGRVRELIGEIERRVQAGEVLYVHCWGGRGRAGTVGACLIAQLYGLDAEQALARVQRAYNTRGELGAPPNLTLTHDCSLLITILSRSRSSRMCSVPITSAASSMRAELEFIP